MRDTISPAASAATSRKKKRKRRERKRFQGEGARLGKVPIFGDGLTSFVTGIPGRGEDLAKCQDLVMG